jgi:hypothetical protein
MRYLKSFATATLVLYAAACGTETSPVEKCDDLVDVLCDRGVRCVGGSHIECVQAVKTGLPCGSARSVTSSYDRCIDQLETASCNVLFAINPQTGELVVRLPADCMGVILTLDDDSTATSPLASSSTASDL